MNEGYLDHLLSDSSWDEDSDGDVYFVGDFVISKARQELITLRALLTEARTVLEPFIWKNALNEKGLLTNQMAERKAVADFLKKLEDSTT